MYMGELDCIRNRWAIISELYFTGIAVEQPIIRHAEGSTIELNALQCPELLFGRWLYRDPWTPILVCLTKRILPQLQFL